MPDLNLEFVEGAATINADPFLEVTESFEVYPPPSIEEMAANQCAMENDKAKTNP